MTPTLEILTEIKYKIKFDIISEECYSHNGYKNKLGYKSLQFRYNTNKYSMEAHRASYMLHNNVQLKTTDVVMHICDNPSCINPKHLKLGSHNDNVQDRVNKKRSAVGIKNGRYIHGKYCK